MLALAVVWLIVAPVATYLVSGQAGGSNESTTPTATSNPSPVPLTATAPQTANTTATTTQPSGVQGNSPRWAAATVTNNPADVPGSSMVNPNTSDAALSITEPIGLAGLVSPRNVNFTAVITAPQGNMPAITPQTAQSGDPTGQKPAECLPGFVGSHVWSTGQFNVDINADGTPAPVYFVLTIFTSNFAVVSVDLSSDDSNFCETAGGSLSNGTTGTDDDERITSSGTLVRLGAFYTFQLVFGSSGGYPGPGSYYASVTASTWYVATVNGVDLDGDGSADDTYYAAISDTNSDGIYDRLDLSIGDNVFGEGDLSDGIVDYSATNNTNDERLSGAAYVEMGVNKFQFTFDTTPGGAPASTLSATWWTATLNLDANANGNKTDAVDTLYYVLTDTDSDGVYDRLDLSLVSISDDDERLLASQGLAKDVTLGSQLFVVSFVRNPGGALATADVTIQAKTWYKGAFTIDIDANGSANDTVNFVLVDSDSDGLYDTMGLSTNDTDYGDGDHSNQQTGANDDETIASGEDVRLGDYYTFTVAFVSNPGALLASVASITSKTWFTGTFTIDSDGDEAADDIAYFVLSDSDSDGRYDIMDIETDDGPGSPNTLGEGTLSGQNPRQTGVNDDERLGIGTGGGNAGGSAEVRLGSHIFTVSFDNNPAAPTRTNDARVTSRWYAGTLDGLPFVQVSPTSNGLYTVLEYDANSSGSYDASEVFSSSPVNISIGGSQGTLTWRSNPNIANSTTLSVTGGGQATANPANLLNSSPEAALSASNILSEQAEQARKEADAQDAPESTQPIPAQAAEPPPVRVSRDINNQPLAGDEVVLTLDPTLADPERRIRQIVFATGGFFTGSVSVTRTYQLQFPVGDLTALDKIISRLEGFTGVASASHHYLLADLARTPNDSKYPSWGEGEGDGWDMRMMRLPEAWETTTGQATVRVAVLDADFDRNHEDLRDNVASISAPKRTKAGGHGTHVSGTICAKGDNAVGVAGVVWDCSLLLYDFGGASPVKAQEAMIAAVQSGARIINMSLQWVDNNQCGTVGTSVTSKKVEEVNNILKGALDYAKREGRDVLWVFAAGNECRDTRYAAPASLVSKYPENVIVVGSVGPAGDLSYFSNYGNLVTVVAPGEDILSTLPNNEYGLLSGTSMATPHVSGLAALIMSRNTGLTAAQVKQCIVGSAQQASANHRYKLVNAAEAMKCGGAAPSSRPLGVYGGG